MIDHGFSDRTGRRVTLREVDSDNWRAVADVAPLDSQRDHVPALAARYLLLSMREDTWNSLAVHADDLALGHVMWARDDDGSYWIGGMLIDGPEQGRGIGRAVMRTLTAWLAEQDGCEVVRLSYAPGNTAAAALYTSLGFRPTDAVEDDEVVVELPARDAVVGPV
ncbi:GNAT family N-acetyltransferase [Streptomyces sp. NBC_00887]|uniref:GNAT family N-acetyltransferase n=1 Tax=Streptomyces sp. NBC_00887 TaxID=2975859 RepID=UPI0038702998|nr:GNAT family N-acetyltransferase [Streptomyces sp. NBC_00887]